MGGRQYRTTGDYERFIAKNGITYEQARAAVEAAVEAHNAEETSLFARSIAAKALIAKG